ncbi:DUF393 domain-containing protein [Synechococcales cyanobacterium C]|uniref:DUF393 domain-containing protein n=1 Tax=Petrachloros mirabilis ULC683 TaxID=2781853 RepID=A0A8K1ZYG3_9CYAN|nr:DCC1-like thiol-disulfide oxidoreductase family protein [Petrachloros mirabilis]NCJ06421.1 DUF393 domain-containing protein [Petrachloros mirabilis ULC683]
MSAPYRVIFDGRCNLCTTLVQALERLDQGQRFHYIPMQDEVALQQWHITPEDCEQGMILIQVADPQQRWQGSEAAEEIARLLPGGAAVIQTYRALPGLKGWGDRTYEQVRDNRYAWFGQRSETYASDYPHPSEDVCSSCP